MKQMCLAFFLVLSLLGSLLILLSLSIYLKHTVEYKLEEFSPNLLWILKLSTWELYSIMSIAFFCCIFLLLDVIFVIWFVYNLKIKKLAALSTSTYKRYSDVEYQWSESMLKSELTKPNESFQVQLEVESEKTVTTPTSSTPNTSLQECEIRQMLSEAFDLDESNLSDTLMFVQAYFESEDSETIAEAIVLQGDKEVLIN